MRKLICGGDEGDIAITVVVFVGVVIVIAVIVISMFITNISLDL